MMDKFIFTALVSSLLIVCTISLTPKLEERLHLAEMVCKNTGWSPSYRESVVCSILFVEQFANKEGIFDDTANVSDLSVLKRGGGLKRQISNLPSFLKFGKRFVDNQKQQEGKKRGQRPIPMLVRYGQLREETPYIPQQDERRFPRCERLEKLLQTVLEKSCVNSVEKENPPMKNSTEYTELQP